MPEAISGQGGHTATWNVARKLADFGLSESEILSILVHDYNPRCDPPWTDQELAHKANDAFHKREPRPIEDRPRSGVTMREARSNGHAEPPALDPDDPGGEPPGVPAEATSDDAESAQQCTAPPPQTGQLIQLADILAPAVDVAERRHTGEERPVPLLFPAHSEILGGGLFPGMHSTVANTGTGKSTFWLQNALYAAENGCPALYIPLELNRVQLALRLLGDEAAVSWSKLYTGRATPEQIAKARGAIPALSALPFYLEFGTPNGWPATTMLERVEQIRRKHPAGPLLIVLDFLQIVGAEPGPDGRTPDLREAIKRAAYVGTHVGNKYGAAVVLVSSAARDKYGLLASTAEQAGFTSRKMPGHIEPRRTILNPDALLGLGKEAGEIEYASESQTVLIRWPAPLDNGEKAILVAVPKLRYGPPGWFALSFWQRFQDLPIKSLEELPEVAKRGGKGKSVDHDELEARVLETVRAAAIPFTSKTALANATTGEKSKKLKVIDQLLEDGVLVQTDLGLSVRGSEEANR